MLADKTVKFRKKSVVVEAFRFTGRPKKPGWPPFWLATQHSFSRDGDVCLIHTLEGIMAASRGDWIIHGVAGEFYPIKDSILRKTYDVA